MAKKRKSAAKTSKKQDAEQKGKQNDYENAVRESFAARTADQDYGEPGENVSRRIAGEDSSVLDRAERFKRASGVPE